ncbi:MAG: recombination protein RecR [Firmicutes bacterium]|nr:recombination protein RecR [Bacillota bacterium]
MAYQYPKSLQDLIGELSRLPGLGPKAAQRLSFHLLAHGEDSVALARALVDAKNSVRPCPRCGNFTDQPLCPICADPGRDRGLLAVVESVADLISLERSGRFHGLYHVLGGVISPLDGVGPEALNLASLLRRVEEEDIREVILATNPTAEGEATALFLAKKLKELGVSVSRIAHGMPVGGSLAFTDEATLDLAIAGRKPI